MKKKDAIYATCVQSYLEGLKTVIIDFQMGD